MTFLRNVITAGFLLPVLSGLSLAQEAVDGFPAPLSETVSDFAEALDATEEGRISRILAETREKTGIALVVVTIAGAAGLNGQDLPLEELGRGLFGAWELGDKDRNDGILILIDTAAHDARFTLGTGFPPVYEERAARVLSTALLPALREGRTADAIEAAIGTTRDRLIAPFLVGEPVTATEGFEEASGNLALRIALAAVGILGFAGISIWRRARAKRMCPKCRGLTLNREREVITAPTRFQNGLGLEHVTCTSCGFADRHSFSIKYSDKEDAKARESRMRPAAAAARNDRGSEGTE